MYNHFFSYYLVSRFILSQEKETPHLCMVDDKFHVTLIEHWIQLFVSLFHVVFQFDQSPSQICLTLNMK